MFKLTRWRDVCFERCDFLDSERGHSLRETDQLLLRRLPGQLKLLGCALRHEGRGAVGERC